MSETKLPMGWDDAKLRRVLAHYEGQTEDDALIEDEAGVQSYELVPEVRELIAKRQR
jgi:hypothetical protein